MVVSRESTPMEAERAVPALGGEIDLTEGVESSLAGLASERSIRERRDVGVTPDRRDGGGEWDHALASLNFSARPNIPGHTNSIDPFRIRVDHLRHCLPGGSKQKRIRSGIELWGFSKTKLKKLRIMRRRRAVRD